jgi:hypothetical protein
MSIDPSPNRSIPELQGGISIRPRLARTPTPYEKPCDGNTKRNRELLLALGLSELKAYVSKEAAGKDTAPAAGSRRRKSKYLQDARGEDGTKAKV